MVLTSRSVQVSWNASFLSCVTGYVISYTSYASSGNVNVNDVYQTSYNLTDLEECTEYNITMHVDSARINPDSIRIMITAYTDSTDTSIVVSTLVLTPRSVEVTWNTFYSSCITGYLISYFSNASYTSGGDVTVNGANQTSYNLTNLEENTEYYITVHVIKNIGTSDSSNGATVTTYTDTPSSPPQNVIVTSIDGVALNVTWKPPPVIHQNGQITSYTIIYYCQLGEIFDEGNVTVNASTTQYIISGLTPFVGYVIKIAARNVNGTGIFFEATQSSGQDNTSIYVNAMVLTPRSVQVTWNTFHSSCITGYNISYLTNASYTSGGNVIINDVNQTSYTLTNLEEYTKYDIIVRVISNIGTSDNSNGETVTTYTDTPSSPPENVTVTSIDGVSLSVAWELPSEIHQNGRIISYEIIYRMYYCELDKIFDEETVTVNATLTQYIISGLTPFVGYVVKIAARNVNGSGVFFEATQVSEKDNTSIYVNAMVLTPRSVQVTWNAFHSSCITGYNISYLTNASYTSGGNVIVIDVNQTSFTITNLEEYTEYDITVRVISNIGTSENSNGVTVTTYTDTPSSPPANVKVTSIDGVSLIVTWRPPPEIHQNGQIIGYEIIYYRREETFNRRNETVDETTTQYIISELTPFVGYVIKIAARNVNGSGIFFEVTQVFGKVDEYCNQVTVEYSGFDITWNETVSGNTTEAPCTGPGLNGTVRRTCISDDTWEEHINCFRVKTQMLLNQAENLSSYTNETETITMTREIASRLVDVTVPTQEPIFAQDINLAVNVISTLNSVTEAVIIANLTANDTFFEDCASVIDNLLSSSNQDSWNQLERTSPSTSQTLVRGAEQIASLLSETLTNDTTEATKTRSNFVIKAEQVSSESLYEDYVFPDKSDNLSTYTGGISRFMITNDVLQNINSTTLTIAISVITNNTNLRLTSSSEGSLSPQVPVSPIFSLQINPPPDLSALMENPIMLLFDVDSTATLSLQSSAQKDQDLTVDDMSCNFYDYNLITNSSNQTGGWSTMGLEVDKSNSNKTLTTCLTRHLTSFAVLISIQDNRPSRKVLSLISYIGCYASLACLCASILLLSYTIFKATDGKNHLFIHLNLCIALALALVVFIAGIENASSNENACKVTAALLQYLFISAFCWMLCEGVFLYMKLVTVFSNKLNKQCFFFILGWGPAILIVTISAGIAHEHYGTNYYCWIKTDDGTIAAFIAPIVVIMLINSIFLAITLKVLWQHKTRNGEAASKKDTVKSLLKAMVILLPLLGMTWIIGIFAVNSETEVFAWIFAILNSLQGFFIFTLNVIRNKQVAKEIKKCCRCVPSSAGVNISGVSSKGKISHDQDNIYINCRKIVGSNVVTSSETLETSMS